MIVWALFDSGNGCYAQGVRELNEGGAEDDNLFCGIGHREQEQSLHSLESC